MKHRWFRFIAAVAVIPLLSSGALAQDQQSELDKIRQQMKEMEARHQTEMKALQDRVEAMSRAQPADAQEVTEMIDELGEEVDEIRGLTDALRPGTTNFLVTGYAFSNFFDLDTGDSSFNAAFFPIFLWRMSDSLFMEAELEFELEGDGGTGLALEFLDLNYVVNDYLTLSAGKFLTPLSNFKQQLHPAWINKLPTQPLFATGGSRLIPTSSLGIMARGAIPIDEMKLTYSAYVSNGFTMQNSGSKIGKLRFKNFEDNNNNKAFGARFGFFPIYDLELFYAFNFGDASSTDGTVSGLDVLIWSTGVNYITESDAIGGRIDARFEYVFSDVDDFDFGPGIGTFDNERQGGYAQIAYRPTQAGSFLEDLEFVFRYDFLDQPGGAPDPSDIDRYTFGVNYWLSPSAVFKVAFQFEDVDDPSGAREQTQGLLLQFAVGF